MDSLGREYFQEEAQKYDYLLRGCGGDANFSLLCMLVENGSSLGNQVLKLVTILFACSGSVLEHVP